MPLNYAEERETDAEVDATDVMSQVSKETMQAREALLSLPFDTYIEIPGRPSVVYQLRDYSERKHGQATTGGKGRYKHPSHFRSPGAKMCREDIPFLFKAFELGHPLPPVPGTKEAEGPRASTIHEYLDWTVSAAEGNGEDETVRSFFVPSLHVYEYAI